MKPAFFSLFLLLFSWISDLSAQSTANVPDWVKTVNCEDPGEDIPPGISQGIYYLLVDEQSNTVSQEDFYHYAMKVVSESGLTEASQFETSFEPLFQQLFIHYVKIHRNGVVIDRTNEEHFMLLDEEKERKKGILRANKTVYANLRDIRKGDVVEYAFSRRGYQRIFEGTFTNNLSLSYGMPVGHLYRRLLLPAGTRLSIKNINYQHQPIQTIGKFSEYVWDLYDSPVTESETNIPSWYTPHAMVQVSGYQSWAEVKTWGRKIFTPANYEKERLIKLRDSLVFRYPADKEAQITAAVDFVQNSVRYSGYEIDMYVVVPHDPDYVLRNRYGDCKDKSLLLTELLKTLGVQAWPTLVSTTLKQFTAEHLHSTAAFDHCITAIEHTDGLVFIDPTIKLQRGSYHARTQPFYGEAMVLDSTERSFYTVPVASSNKAWVTEDFEIDDATGDARLKAVFRYSGESADDIRNYFEQNSATTIQEAYRSIYNKYGVEVKVLDSVQLFEVPGKNENYTVELYLLKNFWAPQDENAKIISQTFKPFFLNQHLTAATEDTREQPLALRHPVYIDQKITVSRTGGSWNVTDEHLTEENPFFISTFSVTASGGPLQLGYLYESRQDHVPAEQYNEYKEITKRVDSVLAYGVEQAVASADVRGFNWLLLLVCMVMLGCATVAAVQLNGRDMNYGQAGANTSIGGWLVLMGLGMAFTPLALLFSAYSLFSDGIEIDYLKFYLSKDSIAYDPLLGYYLLGSNAANMVLLVFSSFMAYQFFMRRNTFRLYYTWYKFSYLGLLVLDLSLTYLFFYAPGNKEQASLMNETGAGIFRLCIQICVWVPYLWYSDRSKTTFTVPSKKPKIEEQVVMESSEVEKAE